MEHIRCTTFPNGLRVITDSVESMHSVALGIWVGVGTRDEDMRENGVAHMVEHMLFKGTPSRSAAQIVEHIENVGGSMNAYTSREITSYHVHLLAQDAALGLEVLADMYQNSVMPDEEIERERQVIVQEIGMNNDTPDDYVFDQYYERAYEGQTMGAPILGTSDIINGMTRQSLEGYVKRFYSPARTVISAAGGIDHDQFVALVKKAFNCLSPDNTIAPPSARYSGGEIRLQKDLEQAHLILGFEGISRLDNDYYAAQALSTILGGGMSSRLFQEVREKRGLVYSIFSFHSGYQDNGLFGIYAGTGPESLKEIMPVICGEVHDFIQTASEDELARAKAQLKTSLLMGRESMMSRADHQAKYLLFRNEVLNVDTLSASIDQVNLKALKRTAERIFTSRPTLAALGPVQALEAFDQLEKRLAA